MTRWLRRAPLWVRLLGLATALLMGCGRSDRDPAGGRFPVGTWIADREGARALLSEVQGSDRSPTQKAAAEELLRKWIDREIEYVVRADGTGDVRVRNGAWRDVLRIVLERLDRPGEWTASYYAGSEAATGSTATWHLVGSVLRVTMRSVDGRTTEIHLVRAP